MGFLTEDLPLPRADVLLLVQSFATAIVDAFTFQTLGVFVANMTGNSVFLGLGIAGISSASIHPVRSIVALLFFWLGSFVTGVAGNHFGQRKRIYLAVHFALQSLLVLLAALLLFKGVVAFEDNTNLGLIAPMAFAFGSQAASSRPLGVNSITTVVVTSCMVDLFADKNLFARRNVGRNQRAAFVVVFFLGGLIGAFVLKNAGPPWALVLSSIIKMGAAASLLVVAGKPRARAEETRIEAGLKAAPVESATDDRGLRNTDAGDMLKGCETWPEGTATQVSSLANLPLDESQLAIGDGRAPDLDRRGTSGLGRTPLERTGGVVD